MIATPFIYILLHNRDVRFGYLVTKSLKFGYFELRLVTGQVWLFFWLLSQNFGNFNENLISKYF